MRPRRWRAPEPCGGGRLLARHPGAGQRRAPWRRGLGRGQPQQPPCGSRLRLYGIVARSARNTPRRRRGVGSRSGLPRRVERGRRPPGGPESGGAQSRGAQSGRPQRDLTLLGIVARGRHCPAPRPGPATPGRSLRRTGKRNRRLPWRCCVNLGSRRQPLRLPQPECDPGLLRHTPAGPGISPQASGTLPHVVCHCCVARRKRHL